MKRKITIAILSISALAFMYLMGPKPPTPDLDKAYSFDLPQNLEDLKTQIESDESSVNGIKPGNEAKIIWAKDSAILTDYAIVYLHGFSASHEEGAPVHQNLSKKYGCNLYLARWEEHGIDLGDETMADLTADKMIYSAEKALAIGKKIGRKVIVIATSAGGALALELASKHPEIEALVLYSPCIKIFDDNAELADNPWGLQLAKAVQGKDFNDITPKNAEQPKYWTMHYRLEAIVALQNFLTNAMVPATFKAVKCPVFMGYYYEDEEHQDKVVSVKAMLAMFDQLGSENKVKYNFETAKNHVLASHVLSEDYQTVQDETDKF